MCISIGKNRRTQQSALQDPVRLTLVVVHTDGII
jgi:hypothetical protein